VQAGAQHEVHPVPGRPHQRETDHQPALAATEKRDGT
jgi:hypothetical protein